MFPNFQMFFHGMDPSLAVETQARDLAGRLEQFSDRISAIRVTVDPVHQRPRQGIIYRIRIEISTSGGRLVVNREPALDHAHEDIHVAMHDAFDAAPAAVAGQQAAAAEAGQATGASHPDPRGRRAEPRRERHVPPRRDALTQVIARRRAACQD